MLRPHDQDYLAAHHGVGADGGDGASDGGEQAFRRLAASIADVDGAFGSDDCHGRVVPVEAPIHVEGRPGALLLVFTKAEGVLTRESLGSPVSLAGPAATDVDEA